MDYKALVDVGFGVAAFVMAKKLTVTVQLLTALVRGHDVRIENHEQRLVRQEVQHEQHLALDHRVS